MGIFSLEQFLLLSQEMPGSEHAHECPGLAQGDPSVRIHSSSAGFTDAAPYLPAGLSPLVPQGRGEMVTLEQAEGHPRVARCSAAGPRGELAERESWPSW